MIIDNSKSYKQNWAKPWSICITGAIHTRGKHVIAGHVFDNWPIMKTVYFRKDYASYRSAERWAHYYEKKLTAEYGEVLLRKTSIYGPGTEAWW